MLMGLQRPKQKLIRLRICGRPTRRPDHRTDEPLETMHQSR